MLNCKPLFEAITKYIDHKLNLRPSHLLPGGAGGRGRVHFLMVCTFCHVLSVFLNKNVSGGPAPMMVSSKERNCTLLGPEMSYHRWYSVLAAGLRGLLCSRRVDGACCCFLFTPRVGWGHAGVRFGGNRGGVQKIFVFNI